MLSESDQKILLSHARQCIQDLVRGLGVGKLEPPNRNLAEHSGAFVTLWKNGELRGCIGYVRPIGSVYECVLQAAAKAALDDPRFPPVRPEEVSLIEIEISVLSPLRRITNPDDIEVGTHGLIVEHADKQGVLLPQVAVAQGWDRMKFLQQTMAKAGLSRKQQTSEKTSIFTFTADVFSDHDTSFPSL